MASLNKVFLIGNLTRDPELRYTPSGVAVVNLRLAANRRFKDRNGEFKSTNSLRPDDLPAVRDLLTQAEDFLNGNAPETADDVL